jgi:hypothetical protein
VQQWLSKHAAKPRQDIGESKETVRAKPQQPTSPSPLVLAEAEPLPVSNAGLALLWPMLPRWLSETGLIADQRFVDAGAQNKAVLWLDALAWGGMPGEAIQEWRMPFSKHLCGLPLDTLLEPWELTPAGRAALAEQQEQWLATLPRQLPQLQRLSVQDLRSMFLQRPGQLRWQGKHWALEVEPDASDVLLCEVPCETLRVPLVPQGIQTVVSPEPTQGDAHRRQKVRVSALSANLHKSGGALSTCAKYSSACKDRCWWTRAECSVSRKRLCLWTCRLRQDVCEFRGAQEP